MPFKWSEQGVESALLCSRGLEPSHVSFLILFGFKCSPVIDYDYRLYCQGNLKLTNHIGDLLGCLMKGSIPVHWTTFYTTSPNLSVGAWISDLAARCTTMKRHCTSLTNPSPSAPASYWLGGMFSPEAFITATRQHTAQVWVCCIEKISLIYMILDELMESRRSRAVSRHWNWCAGWSLRHCAWEVGFGRCWMGLFSDLDYLIGIAMPAAKVTYPLEKAIWTRRWELWSVSNVFELVEGFCRCWSSCRYTTRDSGKCMGSARSRFCHANEQHSLMRYTSKIQIQEYIIKWQVVIYYSN